MQVHRLAAGLHDVIGNLATVVIVDIGQHDRRPLGREQTRLGGALTIRGARDRQPFRQADPLHSPL